MAADQLSSLETKIDQVIALLCQTKLENNSLRKKLGELSHENSVLYDKKKHAEKEIKTLIAQLQDELLCQTES